MLSVPIAETDPLLEGPDQFLGVVHPQPDFDTNELGPDLTFVQDTADLPALDPDEVLSAVYLGHDVSGDPYYIWHSGSPEFRQLIGQIIAAWGSLGRFETSYGSEEVGPALWERDRQAYIAEHGLATGSISSGSTSDGATFTAEWHGCQKRLLPWSSTREVRPSVGNVQLVGQPPSSSDTEWSKISLISAARWSH